jgi:hypothetical protein
MDSKNSTIQKYLKTQKFSGISTKMHQKLKNFIIIYLKILKNNFCLSKSLFKKLKNMKQKFCGKPGKYE